MALVVRIDFHCSAGVTQEGEEPRAGFVQAVDDVGAFQPHLRTKALCLASTSLTVLA